MNSKDFFKVYSPCELEILADQLVGRTVELDALYQAAVAAYQDWPGQSRDLRQFVNKILTDSKG
jgi:hypothetical protein